MHAGEAGGSARARRRRRWGTSAPLTGEAVVATAGGAPAGAALTPPGIGGWDPLGPPCAMLRREGNHGADARVEGAEEGGGWESREGAWERGAGEEEGKCSSDH